MDEAQKILTTDNIPDDVNEGKGGLTVFECHNEKVFNHFKVALAGSIFHLKDTDGRMYIKCGNRTIEELKKANFL